MAPKISKQTNKKFQAYYYNSSSGEPDQPSLLNICKCSPGGDTKKRGGQLPQSRILPTLQSCSCGQAGGHSVLSGYLWALGFLVCPFLSQDTPGVTEANN